MKKLSLLCALAGMSATLQAGEAPKIISVNRGLVFQKSKPGASFIGTAQKRQEEEMAKLEAKAGELQKESARLEQQRPLLSKEEAAKREQALAVKARSFERDKNNIAEELKLELEGKQMQIFASVQKAAQKVFEDKGADLMVDPGANPSIVAVKATIDATDDVIKLVDADFEKSHKEAKKEKVA